MSPWAPPLSASPAVGYKHKLPRLAFCDCAEDLNPGPHVCTADTLLTELPHSTVQLFCLNVRFEGLSILL